MSDLERNKQHVLAFYDLMFNQCRAREAIEHYTGTEYIPHNPGVADGTLLDGARMAPCFHSS